MTKIPARVLGIAALALEHPTFVFEGASVMNRRSLTGALWQERPG
jgi:hypothetical protein